MTVKEVELKFRVDEEVALALRHELFARGGRLLDHAVTQRDTYYTSRHKDFIRTEECLRIRHEGATTTLTWKPPTGADMPAAGQYWKQELNLDVSGQEETIEAMLVALDFVEYVTVRKTRSEFAVDESTHVAVDLVDGAGVFVEVETLSADPVGAARKNRELAASLGLSDCEVVTIPYRDLVPRPGQPDSDEP